MSGAAKGLISDKELSSIYEFLVTLGEGSLIKGLRKCKTNLGHLTQDTADSLDSWFGTCVEEADMSLVENKTIRVEFKDAKHSYKMFCVEYELEEAKQNQFTQYMKTKGYDVKRFSGGSTRGFKGIVLH